MCVRTQLSSLEDALSVHSGEARKGSDAERRHCSCTCVALTAGECTLAVAGGETPYGNERSGQAAAAGDAGIPMGTGK